MRPRSIPNLLIFLLVGGLLASCDKGSAPNEAEAKPDAESVPAQEELDDPTRAGDEAGGTAGVAEAVQASGGTAAAGGEGLDETAGPDEAIAAVSKDEGDEGDEPKRGDDGKPASDPQQKTSGTQPSKKPADAAKPAQSGDEPTLAQGKEIFTKRCRTCHGGTGAADTKMGKKHDIPDWTQAGWKTKWPVSKVRDITANGKAGTKMKAFKDKLSAEELDIVSKYAYSLGK